MIKHDEHRFFISDEHDKLLAEMEYSESEKIVIISHTLVDDSLRGQGVGRKLLNEVVAYAQSKNKKILPLCPYALSVFQKDTTLAFIWDR